MKENKWNEGNTVSGKVLDSQITTRDPRQHLNSHLRVGEVSLWQREQWDRPSWNLQSGKNKTMQIEEHAYMEETLENKDSWWAGKVKGALEVQEVECEDLPSEEVRPRRRM